MNLFFLYRTVDVSGTSGTGRVAEGVIFPNGKCVLYWNSKYSSIEILESLDDVLLIHGHNGLTKLILDGYEYSK